METTETPSTPSRWQQMIESLKERLDLFARFLRSTFLAYIFIAAYVTMLMCLLVMVFIIARYFITTSSKDALPQQSDVLAAHIKSKDSFSSRVFLPIVFMVSGMLLLILVNFLHFRNKRRGYQLIEDI